MQYFLPDPVDVHIGMMIRLKRKSRGVTQTALADACQITFQQVQKYERATNRVSAAMLVRIAARLKTPVSDFYPPTTRGAQDPSFGSDELPPESDGYKLGQIYLELDATRRHALLTMARALEATMANEGRAGIGGATPGASAPPYLS